MSTLTLSDEQKKRAEDILKRVENGDASHPMDILDDWEPCPTWSEMDAMCNGRVLDEANELEREEKWVSISNVVGTDAELTDRFEEDRIEKILKWMLAGEFQPKHSDRPNYLEIGGNYYVGSDGNHRTIVSKALGVDEIFAEVTVIPVQRDS